jgi:predicted tellurium resistance membrane protein TerC
MSTAQDQRNEQSSRLDRIETKLDSMSDAIISLARAEEKISTLMEIQKQQGAQILAVINRIETLDGMVRDNQSTVHVINKIFWIVLTATAAAIAGMLFIK